MLDDGGENQNGDFVAEECLLASARPDVPLLGARKGCGGRRVSLRNSGTPPQ